MLDNERLITLGQMEVRETARRPVKEKIISVQKGHVNCPERPSREQRRRDVICPSLATSKKETKYRQRKKRKSCHLRPILCEACARSSFDYINEENAKSESDEARNSYGPTVGCWPFELWVL